MDKKTLKPRIRFANFTDAWEQRKVREAYKVTRGNVLAATKLSANKSFENPYPVYSSQTKDNGLMGYYNQYLYHDAITWTTDGANAGTVRFRKGKFYCTNVCGVLLSDTGLANKMTAEALNRIAWKYVSKVGNPKLMNNVMADIEFVMPSINEQNKISALFENLDNLITLHQREDLAQISPDKDLITISTSLFSNSWMMCRYVFWVVVILACPRRLATLAIETPANNSNEAWVCLKPWIEMTGIFRDKQCLFKISFTVELYTLFCAKNGASSGKPFKSSENCTTVCQSICIFLTEDLFFVGKKPPSDL